MSAWGAELAAAVRAAREAGALHLSERGTDLRIETKSSAIDLVTRVDTACEAVIREIVGAAFPSDAILGEEEGHSGSSERLWIVDPLDGTLNYANGFPYYVVSIALQVAGEVVLGVILDATRDELFVARRGLGATCNGAALTTSPKIDPAQAMLATGFAYDRGRMAENLGLFAAMMGHVRAIRRPGAAALDLANVAAGRLDGFWELYLNPWDVAAGLLLVQEAGGLVSNGAGEPYVLGERSLVVAGPRLHGPVLALLQAAGIER
jgi:myo-inositol-1(or 4)-monophosphatase